MKIRQGFISNSSSSSFIVITTSGIFEKKENLSSYTIGEKGYITFGWENIEYKGIHTKVNFAWSQANYLENKKLAKEYKKLLYKVIKEIKALDSKYDNYEIFDLVVDYHGEYYINELIEEGVNR